MAFRFTFRSSDMTGFQPSTSSIMENRDDELELYLGLADPIGAIVRWHTGIAVPDGWLLCNGTSVQVASYNALFKVVGYTYGGSGANFTLPTVANHIIRY